MPRHKGGLQNEAWWDLCERAVREWKTSGLKPNVWWKTRADAYKALPNSTFRRVAKYLNEDGLFVPPSAEGRPTSLTDVETQELVEDLLIVMSEPGVITPATITCKAFHIINKSSRSDSQKAVAVSRIGGETWVASLKSKNSALRAHCDVVLLRGIIDAALSLSIGEGITGEDNGLGEASVQHFQGLRVHLPTSQRRRIAQRLTEVSKGSLPEA